MKAIALATELAETRKALSEACETAIGAAPQQVTLVVAEVLPALEIYDAGLTSAEPEIATSMASPVAGIPFEALV